MRLWSIHPVYLDHQGLVALWRETLLARQVLEGKTKGYKNHPQLIRFDENYDPIHAINMYLTEIYKESVKRKYKFDKSKISDKYSEIPCELIAKIDVTTGQLRYELEHLFKKLQFRCKDNWRTGYINMCLRYYYNIKYCDNIFRVLNGPIESWEKIK